MRTDVIRLYKTVHTWTGIVAGMALFIAFYAGALTLFKEPIARWTAPPSAGAGAVALAQVPQLIERTLAEHPQAARDFRIHLRQAEDVPARMGWREREAAAGDHGESTVRHYLATLDAQGELQVAGDDRSRVARFIDVLHRVVGLPVDSEENRWVMGAICALYALALVSGVILLLPTLVKDFFALRLGRNIKRMWLDAHNVVGIVSLPFHLVMALTAAGFAFHDGIYAAQDRLLHDGNLRAIWASGAPKSADTGPRDPARMLPPAELIARARALSPGFEPVALQYAQVATPRAAVRVWGRDASAIARSPGGGFVALDPYTGAVQNADDLPGRQSAANATVSSFFTLHFGSFGGRPVAWAYFLLGLSGAFLFYSGNLLWIESRRKAQRRGMPPAAQTRATRLMASATVGVCLGCVCGIPLTIAAAKWLHGLGGLGGDLAAWHMAVYYTAFFGALLFAFLRGAARAAPVLLACAALSCAAIPLTTLAAWLWPALGMWAHGSSAALGVDAVAGFGALAYAWMARATARRARRGSVDSVWS